MSWSAYATGTPAGVCEYLDKQFDRMSASQSKDEFGAALPHLKGLVQQNIIDPEKYPDYKGQPIVKLEASGSGYKKGEDIVQQSCSCKIEVITPNC